MREILVAVVFLLSGCGSQAMSGLDPQLHFSDSKAGELASSACEGNADAVARILNEGVPVDGAGKSGITPLGFAVRCPSLEGVKALLVGGADPNSRNESGSTPVSIAALHNGPEMLKLLLDHGGEVNVADKSGSTALMQAFSRGMRTEMGQDWRNFYLLLEQGADVNQADENRGVDCFLCHRGGAVRQGGGALGERLFVRPAECGLGCGEPRGSCRSTV